jgi:hypothetical protein
MSCTNLKGPKGACSVFCANGQMKRSTFFECEIHDLCLPFYAPGERELSQWNDRKPHSDVYALCHGCPDFTPRTA